MPGDPPPMAAHADRESLEISDDYSDDGFPPSPPGYSYRLNRYTRPLIDYVRNEWQTSAKYTSLSLSPGGTDSPRWVQMFMSMVTAPRFRRYAIIYLVLLVSCLAGWMFVLSPRLEEHEALLHSLDPSIKDDVGGWFGTNALPRFDNITQLRDLDASLLPAVKAQKDGQPSSRRLIFIGDVHGCKDELELLLDEVSFDHERDHLIFVGDMINKGPDSLGVVDLARKYSASCVRGNHEDRVLLLRHDMESSNTLSPDSDGGISPDLFFGLKKKERALARQLSSEQVQWLGACPVILNVGQIPEMGQVVVLDKQDASSVMNMLTIDLDTHVPSSTRKGTMWTKLFNKHQSLLYSSLEGSVPDPKSQVMTVIYGHDSKSSLSLKTYTKGLDSGCVKGGKLTAMVVEDGGKQSIIQVRCRDHRDE
ncbi:putative serine/threonine-protein phosphatase [Aspergillus novofumigatus IBT 16806]|uniref:Ser/Thr protein phosphatase family n=1 Tax=Aspergillus novofumigatus (strain IBT 16806) TaxID=1392255 RepID=A0A2I1CHL9_ASPN1|nr:Ser/Thr protein phosphatase family [Aspergillus novofumigatus IBT 16806]PKX97125.1 Ser/Thr protein phosphatase family [Aspergillus novofumigatus IBT 16806]